MPATSCTNPIVFDFSQGPHGECQFLVELTHDGVSVPPNCNGVVSRVFFHNEHDRIYYARLPATRVGPRVYQIVPGGDPVNITNRSILHLAGLDDRSDLIAGSAGLGVSELPPQAGEILLNP